MYETAVPVQTPVPVTVIHELNDTNCLKELASEGRCTSLRCGRLSFAEQVGVPRQKEKWKNNVNCSVLATNTVGPRILRKT